MENLLIHIYLFVCQTYDTSSNTCFQRTSNNRKPEFTDQELITIWFFAHLEGCFEKKRMHRLIENYWREWFPRLPSYQTFVLRLNRLEATFQTFGTLFLDALATKQMPERDHLVDSLPVMLAQHGHSYRARVAREIADVGFCAAKKTRFHGVRLHFIAQRRSGALPRPSQMGLLRSLASRLESVSSSIARTACHRALRRFSLSDRRNYQPLASATDAADHATQKAERR